MGQLTELFLRDADLRVTELREALAAGDATGASEAAHTLSGAAGNLGATDLAGLCTKMALRTTGSNGASERLVHDDDALLADIDAELARVRSALGSPALTR
jgi:HPt (histidine-containing phosphotransfer) domain-containing protein